MSPVLAVLMVFAVLLMVSDAVVRYRRYQRSVENMRAVDALRKERVP